MKKFFLSLENTTNSVSLGLLILRVSIGSMMLTHGIPKLMGFSKRFHTFSDPLGLGSEISYLGTVFGEVFCSLAIIMGLYTRIASTGLAFVMAVAALIVHSSDPFGRKELALIYLTCSLVLFFTGPGKYSLDNKLLK